MLHRLLPYAGVPRRQGPLPIEGVRHVGDNEAGVVDLAAELAHRRIRRLHLDPGVVAEPELDALEAGPLDEDEPLLEAPVLLEHVVADRFLHGPPRSRGHAGGIIREPWTPPRCGDLGRASSWDLP